MMICPLLLLVLLPVYASAGGSVSVNIKDLGAIEGIQSLDIRGAKWVNAKLPAESKKYISTEEHSSGSRAIPLNRLHTQNQFQFPLPGTGQQDALPPMKYCAAAAAVEDAAGSLRIVAVEFYQ